MVALGHKITRQKMLNMEGKANLILFDTCPSFVLPECFLISFVLFYRFVYVLLLSSFVCLSQLMPWVLVSFKFLFFLSHPFSLSLNLPLSIVHFLPPFWYFHVFFYVYLAPFLTPVCQRFLTLPFSLKVWKIATLHAGFFLLSQFSSGHALFLPRRPKHDAAAAPWAVKGTCCSSHSSFRETWWGVIQHLPAHLHGSRSHVRT